MRWKPLPKFEDTHEYNDIGQIRSKDRLVCKAEGALHKQKGRILKPFKKRNRLYFYKLHINKRIYNVSTPCIF